MLFCEMDQIRASNGCKSNWYGVCNLIILCMLFNLIGFAVAETISKEMTFSVEAGRKDCFYQNVQVGETIDLEYQVIDGGHGDIDISFVLNEPDGRIVYADYKKSDNVHRFKASKAGDYALCFDNTISRFNKKTVFFELLIEDEGTSDKQHSDDLGAVPNWPTDDQLGGLTPEEFYDMKIEDIESAIGRVRAHLTKARQTQDILRSYEARDRNVAEANNSRVQVWSLFQIAVMLAVGGLQVIMVRSLFETDSRVTTIWKKISM